jgi:hypothetical protein
MLGEWLCREKSMSGNNVLGKPRLRERGLMRIVPYQSDEFRERYARGEIAAGYMEGEEKFRRANVKRKRDASGLIADEYEYDD